MQQSATGSLSAYVTSSFYEHSLTATTGIMSSLIGGLWSLPLAKILDLWGRPQAFLLMLTIATLGLIMMAACNNVATYAAAQVFYWVGYVYYIFHLQLMVRVAKSGAYSSHVLQIQWTKLHHVDLHR